MSDILILIGMFIAGVIFMWLRPKIFKKAKQSIKENIKFNASIGNVYKKNGEEVFQWKKFRQGFGGLLNSVAWSKDFVSLFNIRKLIIYTIILTTVFAYGWYKRGKQQPIYIDIAYGKEVKMELMEGNYLYIHKDGTVYLHDKNGNILKQITVSDIPELKRKLAPIGFQLKPIGILAGGLNGGKVKGEVGGGISFLRYWKWRLETFLTNMGIYLGTSYKITNNSGIGLGIGKGWKGDNRVILYYKWKF